MKREKQYNSEVGAKYFTELPNEAITGSYQMSYSINNCRNPEQEVKLPDLKVEQSLDSFSIQQSCSKGADHDEKMRNLKTRTILAVIMISGFLLILSLGHLYASSLVILIILQMYSEIMNLKRNEAKDNKSFIRYIDSYNLITFIYIVAPKFFLRRTLIQSAFEIDSLPWTIFVSYHSLISFALVVLGFVAFVLNLYTYGNMLYQIKNWSCSMLTSMFLCYLGFGFSYTIYQGLFWFFLCTMCVIVNDIAAYLVGLFFGKTPLIQLSPKKTWEGFIGGLIFTFIWAFMTVRYLASFKFLVCPQNELTLSIFQNVDCEISDIFFPVSHNLYLWPFQRPIIVMIAPIQIHAAIIATFASLIAPFGGFFASGLKRALKIKNFGTLIPGHGGMVDRMDCKAIMGIFIYVYLAQIVFRYQYLQEQAFDHFMNLEYQQKLEFYNYLIKNINETSSLFGKQQTYYH